MAGRPAPRPCCWPARPTRRGRWWRPRSWPPSPPRPTAGAACASSTRSTVSWSTTGRRPPAWPPQGAFYVYARSDGLDGDSMRLARRLLDEAGVAAVPGCDFGDHEPEAHLRFSYTTALDQITEGVRRLTAWRASI